MGKLTHPLHGKFRHYDGDGRLNWASGEGRIKRPVFRGDALEKSLIAGQLWTPNALADEGEEDILDIIYRGATAPTSFYGRLYNDTPVDTDTLATLTGEASGNGYANEAFARNGTDFPTLALDSGDFQVSSATKTYSASGGSWGPVTYFVLATVATGTAGLLYNYIALSASRTLNDGDSLDVSISSKLA